MSRACFAFAISLVLGGFARPADDELLVVAAARKRQEAIRSIEVKYRLEVAVEPGGEWTITRPIDGKGPRQFPETRLVGRSENRLVLDGVKFHSELTLPDPLLKSTGWLEEYVFDGEFHRRFTHPNPRAGTRGSGRLSRPKSMPRIEPSPLELALRVPNEFTNPDWRTWGKWRYVGPRTSLFGDATDEYECQTSPDGEMLRLWTDPARGHLIVAMKGRKFYQLDIWYARHAGSGLWLPTGWSERAFHSDGSLSRTTTGTVTSVVVNQPRPLEEFVLAFPKGLSVSDEIRGLLCVVGENGELVPRPSPEPPTPTPVPIARNAVRTEGLVIVLVVVAVMLFGFVLVRMRARRTVPPT